MFARHDCHARRYLRFTLAAILAGALHPAATATGQAITVDYAEASRVVQFENATRLSVGIGALYVVDGGDNNVTHIDPRTGATRSGGGGGDPDGPSNPVDVDASTGLTFLIADQSGTIHRYAQDFAALEVLRILPERHTDLASIASIDERTIFGVSGDGSLFRWTRDRGPTRLDAGSGAEVDDGAAAAGALDARSRKAYAQVVANARNVFVLARDEPRVYVLDAFGGYLRAINSGPNADISGLTVSADVLWLLRKQATETQPDEVRASTRVEGYNADGELLSQVILRGFRETVVGAAVVQRNLWVLTSTALYVFDS